MKYLSLIAMMGLLTMSGFSQDETLFSGSIDCSGYGGPMLKISQLDGKAVYLLGGYGG